MVIVSDGIVIQSKSQRHEIFVSVELEPHTFLSGIWGEKSGGEHWRYKNEGDPLRTASQRHYLV
jgi:hypothetical protein